jgi:phosphate acetyltransferase/phosphate butyryltransferase
MALQAAACILDEGVARPVLVGNPSLIARAADAAGVDEHAFEIIPTEPQPAAAARRATILARDGELRALMKGSLHTDELMAAVVDKANGLRGDGRISHAFLFDLPRYHKMLGLSDCVVNISPSLEVKQDILSNAIALLRRLGLEHPKVAVIAAVETLNPAIPATVHAQELVRLGQAGRWPGAIVEGSLGFDNAFSMEAARTKRIDSRCAGDFDLMLVPDLNAGNLLYKSFIYVGGGECAGLVIGARAPIVLTSRADSLTSRLASVALAVVASRL